jgi:hypothetical protein
LTLRFVKGDIPGPGPEPTIKGDVYGDGEVTIADVNVVIERILHPDNDVPAADVNNDGEVNIADIQLLVDVVQGKWQRHDAATLIRADVNQDHEILISDINSVIDLILK